MGDDASGTEAGASACGSAAPGLQGGSPAAAAGSAEMEKCLSPLAPMSPETRATDPTVACALAAAAHGDLDELRRTLKQLGTTEATAAHSSSSYCARGKPAPNRAGGLIGQQRPLGVVSGKAAETLANQPLQRVGFLERRVEVSVVSERVMGKLIWPAAIAMAELLLRHPDSVLPQGAERRCLWLELGAGCGAVSLVAGGAVRRRNTQESPLQDASVAQRAAALADEWGPRAVPSASAASVAEAVPAEETQMQATVAAIRPLFAHVVATEMTEQGVALLQANLIANGNAPGGIDRIVRLNVLDGDHALLSALEAGQHEMQLAAAQSPAQGPFGAAALGDAPASSSNGADACGRRPASTGKGPDGVWCEGRWAGDVVVCACDLFYDPDVVSAIVRSFALLARTLKARDHGLAEPATPAITIEAHALSEDSKSLARLLIARSANFDHLDPLLSKLAGAHGLFIAWRQEEVVPGCMLEDLHIGPLVDEKVVIFCLLLRPDNCLEPTSWNPGHMD